MEDEYSPPPLSFKQKLKQSLCFSCCFRRHNLHHPLDSPPPQPTISDEKPNLMWLKPNSSDQNLSSEFKGKCKAILGRVTKHRRHSSTEFRYDPLSYSLNFEDGFCDSQLDEAPLKSFSARLPPSPKNREIAAVN